MSITQARLKELFKYNPNTGEFIRRTPIKGQNIGTIAGSDHISGGSRYITADRRRYKAHRLAWLYVYGEIPTLEVDHRNGVGTDNRISNLRLATHKQNAQNIKKHKDNTTGYLGVTYDRHRNKYQSRIMVDGRQIHLGRFDTPELAYSKYLDAKKQYHEFQREPRT